MKQTFPAYYRPTADEFAALWQNAVVVLDANVLLNMYGYSAGTRDSLFSLFETIPDRIWMPHQFALEYQRNRLKAILEQVGNYGTIKKDLRSVLDQHLKPAHRHPFVSRRSMSALERICRELEAGQREYEALISDDQIHLRITDLLARRVGPAPTQVQLDKWHAEARLRIATKVPPGFADSAKPEPECFGDLVGWQQILASGSVGPHASILITDDLKEDWWHIRDDRRIGPRTELIAEYLNTCNSQFYMYTLEQFMLLAGEYLGQAVGQDALREVRERSVVQSNESSAKPTDPLPSGRTTINALGSESEAKQEESYSVNPNDPSPDKPKV